MSDKVQKIKGEIERRINEYKEYSQINYLTESTRTTNQARLLELRELKDFIDSIQEPTSKDLEEEINHISKNEYFNFSDWKSIARHFAEWQKQQDEKLFKDDSWNYIEENYPNISQEEKLRLYDISIKSRLAGANAIKQQMVKDAVGGEYWDGSIYLDNRPTEYEDGNELKIIIIKEK